MPIPPSQCQLVNVFAANVRRRRMELGISQEELAERAGVHRTYIGMLERSEKNATLYSIERLAGALEVEPAVLLLNSAT
ncbi:helix-turn-helix transcriptional regulator [Pseudomonas juntendi]|uniref:Helix-turn-helix transcriptional regulator n=1 Tax=Pseudomonas juntendi TaxID=2666183 RepID=A0A7W2KJJ0_9PSED|nr:MULTISPECIES: helix-turn-helix transcriptional regulator [Pseudomonas]MBA6099675.1 helix-turn-helix transcriptional regulator [Pseudomonas juntendi]